MSMRGVLRVIEGQRLGFWCPGCKEMHVVNAGWQFNGNYDRPTFAPSVLVTGGHYVQGWKGPDCWCNFDQRFPEQAGQGFKCVRCHSFVTDGRIQFLTDSSHELAGQTVAMTVPTDDAI